MTLHQSKNDFAKFVIAALRLAVAVLGTVVLPLYAAHGYGVVALYALVIRGIEVFNIMSGSSTTPAELTEFARVKGTTITYPAPLKR